MKNGEPHIHCEGRYSLSERGSSVAVMEIPLLIIEYTTSLSGVFKSPPTPRLRRAAYALNGVALARP